MSETAEAERLQGIAARLVQEARQGGADVAEASASSGWELTAKVRLGKPELVQEAGHRNVALRVIRSQRVAITSTSDWTEEGLKRCVSDALALAELSEPDTFAGPADPSLLAKGPFVIISGSLHDSTGSWPTAWMVVMLALGAFVFLAGLYHSRVLPPGAKAVEAKAAQ